MPRPALNLSTDPNIAFVSLRATIEQRLRILAKGRGITSYGSVYELVELLEAEGAFNRQVADSLNSILLLADRAAHGSHVPPQVLGVLHRQGGELIHGLDSLIANQLPSQGSSLDPGTDVLVPWEWTEAAGKVVEVRGIGPSARVVVDVEIPGTRDSEELEFPAAAVTPA